jgi:hypothetical protein
VVGLKGGTHLGGGSLLALAMRETSKIASRGFGCIAFAVVGDVRGRGCGLGGAVIGCRDGPVWNGELLSGGAYFWSKYCNTPYSSRFHVAAVRGN